MISREDIVRLFGLRNVSFRGDEITCSCPFPVHAKGDSHPSFGINTSMMVAHCFGCGWSGNLIHLCEQLLGYDRFKALSTIYSDMTVDEAISLMHGTRDNVDRKELSPIECDISIWKSNKSEYWHGRGFSDETIIKWQLGYDSAVNRVVVPIYFRKELLGWSKRRVNESEQPKWSHSEGLQKSRILFGMDNCHTDSCILVEAPLSVIMLDQYGIGGAVASFGCSLSDEQALLIRSNFNNVLIFYDPDEAGRTGTKKALAKLERFVNAYAVGVTRDDPAAMTRDECISALDNIIPSWAYR